MLIDIGWLAISAAIQYYVAGRRLNDKDRIRARAIAAFISYFVFKTMSRAVATSGGSVAEALAVGAAFGAVILAVVILVQLHGLAKAKQRDPRTD